MAEVRCPKCNAVRTDPAKACPACGAAPIAEHRGTGRERPVREDDLEPYVALNYIARLFKILAVLMLILTIAEIIIGIMTQGRAAFPDIIGDVTRLLVLAGLMWAGGDLAILLIDVGHDMRVTRILLGRIDAQLQNKGEEGTAPASSPSTTPSTEKRVPN